MCVCAAVVPVFAHAERMQRPGEDFECLALKSPPYSFKTRVSHRLWLTIGLARLVDQQAPVTLLSLKPASSIPVWVTDVPDFLHRCWKYGLKLL